MLFHFRKTIIKDHTNQTMNAVLFVQHYLYSFVIFISAKLVKGPFKLNNEYSLLEQNCLYIYVLFISAKLIKDLAKQTMNTVLFEQHCLYNFILFISAELFKGPFKSNHEFSFD